MINRETLPIIVTHAKSGQKTCCVCREFKPLSEFKLRLGPKKDRLYYKSTCYACEKMIKARDVKNKNASHSKHALNNSTWSPAEDEFLLTSGLTYRELSYRLKRSCQAIANRKHRIMQRNRTNGEEIKD